jgi:hypothetical protein
LEKSILIDKARKQETSRKMPLLDWLNKSQALKAAASAPFRLLDEVPELSYGDEASDNMLIQGDNLKDGRIVVVEYKGEHTLGSEDTKQKQTVGEIWARKSANKGIFLMAVKRDSQGRDVLAQLKAAIA